MARPKHIMIIAGESSGDALGADLMAALKGAGRRSDGHRHWRAENAG